MTVTEAVERYLFLAGSGHPEEGLKVLLEASYEHSDPALEDEIALCYEERAWARCEDRSLSDGPMAEPGSVWEDDLRSNARALDDFEESLSWSERPEALAGKAFVLLASDPEDSVRLLERASELNSDSPLLAVVWARLHLLRRTWATAAVAAGKAIAATPEFPAAHRALAEALQGAGKPAEALQALARAATLMPYNVELILAWAAALEVAGDTARAADLWRRASEISRLHPAAWRGLAWNAAARGAEEEMLRTLAEAERLDPVGTALWLEREAPRRPELLRDRS